MAHRRRTRITQLLLGALMLSVVCFLPAFAFAQTPGTGPDRSDVQAAGSTDESAFSFPVEVTVEDGRVTRRDMIETQINEDGRAHAFHGESLRLLLDGLLNEPTADTLEDNRWPTFEELGEAGLEATYDSGSLAASVRVPTAIQPVQNISVRGSRSASDNPRVAPATVSLSLPFYLAAETGDNTGNNVHYGLNLQPQVGLGATVLTGALDYSAVSAAGGVDEVTLDSWEAALSRDFEAGSNEANAGAPDSRSTTRVTAGTTRIDALGFMSSQPVFGVGVERREGIGSAPVLTDRYQSAFEVQTPSTADIYVNDRLIRSSRLAPGSYRISDFPLVPGRNEIRIVITDAYGQERTIKGSVSHAPGLLPRGDTSFGVSAGVVGDIADADYDTSLLRGYIRHGVSDGLSADMYGEAAAGGVLLGMQGITAGRAGTLELSGAAVYRNEVEDDTEDDVEYAARGRYQVRVSGSSWAPSLGVTGLFRTGRFYAPSALSASRSSVPPWVVSATVNQPLSPNASLLLGSRSTITGDQATGSSRLFGYFTTTIGRLMNVRAGAAVRFAGSAPEVTADITLSTATPGGEASYRGTYHVVEESLDLGATQNFSGRAGSGSVGVTIDRLARDGDTAAGAGASARAQNSRGELSVSARMTAAPATAEENEQVRQTSAATFRGRIGSGLYFAGGVLGIGRPSTGSFALVARERNLPSGALLVNAGTEGYEARTGVLGAAVLPSLPDYSEKRISTELPGLPVDYTRDAESYTVETGYNTGSAVRIGGSRLLYGAGVLEDDEGEPVTLQVFRITDGDGSTVTTGFTDEQGRFSIYDLTPGQYSLTLSDDTGGSGADFSLEENSEPPFDLEIISYPVNGESSQ